MSSSWGYICMIVTFGLEAVMNMDGCVIVGKNKNVFKAFRSDSAQTGQDTETEQLQCFQRAEYI